MVSLNLITTFPDADFQRPPQKADQGTVRLGFIPPAGTLPVPIGDPLPYDATHYELTGGVVDVAFDPNEVDVKALEQGMLVFLATSTGQPSPLTVLSEANSSITIEIADRGVYCDVGDCGSFAILVRERGGPPRRDVDVYLWEYQFVNTPGGYQQLPPSTLTLVEHGPPLQHRIQFPEKVVFPKGLDRRIRVDFQALLPGSLALAFTLDGNPLSGDYPWPTATYAGVRVMPDDRFDDVPRELRLSWKFIYETIFRYYRIVYPAMSQHIPFDNQEAMEKHCPGRGETDRSRKLGKHALHAGQPRLVDRQAHTADRVGGRPGGEKWGW